MVGAIVLALAGASVQVKWVPDQAEQMIALIEGRGSLARLEQTEGQLRLRAREEGMGRSFALEDFSKLAASPPFPAQEYREALDRLARVDYQAAGLRAARYLPPGAEIRASVYPLIKPRTNSFVWDLPKNPAIMLWLDPSAPAARVENTVAHELHHVGYASSCPSPAFSAWLATQPPRIQEAWKWAGALGEGFAVLAAATDPDSPVAASEPEVRKAWSEGMANLDRDFGVLARLLTDIADGRIPVEEAPGQAARHYGIQGPWYTVGFVTARTIEDSLGRRVLIQCMSDPRLLFPAYHRARARVPNPPPAWPASLVKALGGVR